jgi:rhamnose transport system permease protein
MRSPLPRGGRGLVSAFRHEAFLLLLLAALLGYAASADASFLAPAAQVEMSTHVGELALLALPMTLIILTGGIDLSVGAVMALSAVVLGLSFEAGLSPWVGAGFALLTGVAAGLLNGVFVAFVRVHPLLVTLATLAAFRGAAEGVSRARPVSGFPEGFAQLGQGTFAGVPVPVLIFVVFAVVTAVALSRTVWGRSLYAIGLGETAARFSGVPVDRIKLWLYTLSGAAAGLAAVLFVARRNTAKADIGQGMELDVITAVVLGGASIFGGRGRIAGTLLGVLLIHETREWVGWHWQRDELNGIVLGVLLIGSVLLQTVLSPRRRGEG